jgi:plasmid stabilization system protein ParE
LGKLGSAKRSRFELALRLTFDRIRANPDVGAPFDTEFRWLKVGRFRYIIYYGSRSPGVIEIFAIAHASRRPGYWLRRTR